MDLEQQLKLLEEDPANVALICDIGKVYKHQNDFDNAQKYFNRALEINPDFCPATCSLMHLLIDHGKYSEGLDLFNNAVNSHKENEHYKATIFNALFAVFLLYKLSMGAPKQANTFQHNYEELFFRMGNAFMAQELHDAAVKVFELATELSPSNARLLINLASCYIYNNENAKAEKILLDLLELFPDDEEILEKLCFACFNQGEFKTSIKFAHRVLDINPDNNFIQNSLAFCYVNTGEFEKAIDIYKKQLSSSPDNCKVYKNLFIAYRLAKRFEESEVLYNELKQTKPYLALELEKEISKGLQE